MKNHATVTKTAHCVGIKAAPKRVYQALEDVASWPRCFPPTVHANEITNEGGKQRIQLWALANEELKTWQSERVLAPDDMVITFAQTQLNDPLTSMVGMWTVEAGDQPESCLVTLCHEFTVTDDNPEYVSQVRAAVDQNSEQELDKLKKALETAQTTTFSFEDSVDINGPVHAAYDFIYECDQWPQRLQHVTKVGLQENDPGLQIMAMTTRAPDGSEHETRSGRVCLTNDRILYKQFQRPPALDAHLGEWVFRKLGASGVRVTSRHHVIINMDEARRALGKDCSEEEVKTLIRETLGGNSKLTLNEAKAYIEHATHHSEGKTMENLTEDKMKAFLAAAMGDDDDINIEAADLDDSLANLGVDSLAIIDVSNKIEREFGIKFPEGSTADIDSMGEFLALSNKLIAQG